MLVLRSGIPSCYMYIGYSANNRLELHAERSGDPHVNAMQKVVLVALQYFAASCAFSPSANRAADGRRAGATAVTMAAKKGQVQVCATRCLRVCQRAAAPHTSTRAPCSGAPRRRGIPVLPRPVASHQGAEECALLLLRRQLQGPQDHSRPDWREPEAAQPWLSLLSFSGDPWFGSCGGR